MSFQVGTAVGAYKIVAKIGQGGMATVYKAYHAALDRYVAIKVLHAAFTGEDSFLRRFSREAKVVAKLEHPHIVPIYDFAEHEGHPYLVMRFVDGETLKDRLTQGMLSPPEILRIATAVADGLQYAHDQGVLHRDIKPSNILLTKGGGVYITDFGLARITQAGESTMSQEMIMGTPQYISPEQAKGNQELDGRTDLYSCAILLYEMVTGRVPFQSDTSYSIIHSQIFDPPPLPSSVNENVSPQMEEVLLKALSKEPDDRYATAVELLTAFRDALDSMPSEMAPAGAAVLPDYTPAGITRRETPPAPDNGDAAKEPTAVPATAAPPKQRSAIFIGAGVLVGILICGSLFLLMQRWQERQALRADDAPPADVVDNDPVDEPPRNPDDAPPPDAVLQLPDRIRPVEELEMLLDGDPENRLLKLELAAAYARDGRSEAARGLINNLFERTRLPIGFIALGEQMLERRQYEMAELVLEEGLARFEADHQLQQLLMMTYVLTGKSADEFERYLDFIAPHDPVPTTIQIGETAVLFQRNDPEAALERLEDAFNEGDTPFPADILYMTGRLLRQIDQPDAAREQFEFAFEFNPSPWLATHIDAEIVQLEP